ncbi:hypothetical protein ACJMK2_036661 [Sinanodonta woodiana]|uniref:RRM domain-containing protein n=1 Tax=Sinanodonta woodiana TaxID=1069815 RepID=A0ABD3WLE0_SINWO
MATIQQYRLGDLSKLISAGSDQPESKKKKTNKKLESLFGRNTQNLHFSIVPAVLSNEKTKSNDAGSDSISEPDSTGKKGGTKMKAKRKHKLDDNVDEVLSTKFRKLEGKEEAIKPRKENVSHSPGYCPPLGIVHEAVLKQKKTEKKKDDIGADEDDPKMDREQQRLKRKLKLKRIKDTDPRTIFIGNLPLSVTKKKLLKLFKKYGDIETIRYRCLPPADPKIPKKVVAIKKDFHSQRHNCVAYICFTTKEGAVKALESNGMQVEDLHIHVDLASQSKDKDKNRSIFVGNIPFDIEEEAIRNHFHECGMIENVRVIRDRKTGLGKGFCYVLFQSKDSVSLALKLNNSVLQKRQLRVMRCTTNTSQLGKDVKKISFLIFLLCFLYHTYIDSVKSKGKNVRTGQQGENREKTKRGDWPKVKTFTPSNMKRSPFQELKARSSKFKKRNKDKKRRQNKKK